MTDIRRTDALFERTLASIVPSTAPVGLQARIHAEVETTRQVRALPWPLAGLADADPIARRRALLLAAALLLVLLGIAGAVGSRLLEPAPVPIPAVVAQPPADLPAFVQGTYARMPELPPVAMTVDADGTKQRILVSDEGAVRIETYGSPDDTEPEAIRIYRGTSMGEVLMVDGQPTWYEQAEAISEDPRVFVYATMGAAAFGALGRPGCEVAISPGEVYDGTPSRGWQWIGMEEVAGRSAHHVRCDGDLWIDAETGLTLRSRGPALDAERQPIPGQARTVEATDVVFETPSADLFALQAPAGMATIDAETYGCITSPMCMASPAPVVMPPPATEAAVAPGDVDALVAASIAATEGLPAFDVTVDLWMAKYPGSSTRVIADGEGRFRVEQSSDGSTDPPWVTIAADDRYYVTETTTDGVRFWRDMAGTDREIAYPLRLPDVCEGGWTVLGVDLILDRPADHLSCPGDPAPVEYWVDHETSLVVRTQSLMSERDGFSVEEVVDLAFGPQPPERFELPPGADVRP